MIFIFNYNSMSRSCTNHCPRFFSDHRCYACQYREIRLCITLAHITDTKRLFFYNNIDQNIIVLLTVYKFCQRNLSCIVKFHPCIHTQKHGQHIRKSIASPNASPYCRTVAKLHSDNVSQTFLYCSMCVFIQTFIYLQFPKWCHTADHKFIVKFLNRIQPQPRKINGCGNITISHLQPHHSAKDNCCFFLIQLIRFCNAFYFHIAFNL